MVRSIFMAVAISIACGCVSAQGFVLSVSGTGQSGNKLVFTTTPQGPVTVNKISFLGLSLTQGKTQFEFWDVDLGWPIIAMGMAGSLRNGPTTQQVLVPELPPGFTIPVYAQSLVVEPRGGGYQVETTNVVTAIIRG